MKSGQVFWGMFFLTIGSLVFAVRFDWIETSWYFIWDLWPVIFILWGVVVMLKNSQAKPFIVALTGIFIAAFIFGSIHNVLGFGNFDYIDIDDWESSTFYEQYDSNSVYANLELNAGVGKYIINDVSRDLISGTAAGEFADYRVRRTSRENKDEIVIDQREKNFRFFRNNFKSKLELQLNPNLIWDLDLNLGAAKAYFDLSPFKIKEVNIQTGATNITLKMSDLLEESYINVDMGAAKIKILVPGNTGCRVRSDLFLVSRQFEDFRKVNDGVYESDNFDYSENKIYFRIDGGVSSVEIEKY
ncbi:MAG: DUF5668 domain-containing protein [Melioribacteraceae bacterium]|nr:DUF5668 domain-containing protein [Melioribacteraceae bacterium]MCF8355978.1 DUF5668 domain-containing protein [Melioribacteraceae bacterium]MCF8394616.1 DUF5668 domain-containing protein [Melioribacteraceae bacterium]MCF8419613.1 DUF5668 domain-containing protein [Melioribacteraceae bacterium]